MVLALIRASFQLRYRQSFVGVAWALLPPLATVAVADLVFHRVIRIDTGDVPYTVFALAALAPWTFFANSVMAGVPSIVQSQPVVTRFSFPRSTLPISAVGLALLDLAVSSLVFVAFVLLTGERLPWTALWFPVLLMVEMAFVIGVVLLGSALNVFARDIRLAVPFVIQLWLLLTPVMYPLDLVPPGLRQWYLLNPMTGIVEAFRQILVYGEPPAMGFLSAALIGSALVLATGAWYFAKTEKRFADVI
jgi:lipopolysaccharide transport system permease protein